MKLIGALIYVGALLTSNAYGQWGQPNPQYQQVCGIPNAPPCPSQYPQYQQPPPQQYGYPNAPQQGYGNPSPARQIDGACLGRCIGQGGTGPQCQRACGN